MKIKIAFLSLLFCSSAALLPLYALSEESAPEKVENTGIVFSAGAQVLYAWWDPIWQKNDFKYQGATTLPFNYQIDPSFVYGPVFSLKFNPNWSLTASGSYGLFKAKALKILTSGAGNLPLPEKISIKKYDADLLVNYNISRYVKFFFGPKYQGYKMSNDKHPSHLGSFGAGFGLSIPVAGNLYILSALSVMGLYGQYTVKIAT